MAANPCDGVRVPAARRQQVQIPELATVETVRAVLPERFRGVVDLWSVPGCGRGRCSASSGTGCASSAVGPSTCISSWCVSPEPPYLGPPKTAESQRVVPLAKVTLDALATHLAEHPVAEVELSDRTDPRNPVTRTARLVFTTAAGGPVTRSQWSQIWNPAARATGVPRGGGPARAATLLCLGAHPSR